MGKYVSVIDVSEGVLGGKGKEIWNMEGDSRYRIYNWKGFALWGGLWHLSRLSTNFDITIILREILPIAMIDSFSTYNRNVNEQQIVYLNLLMTTTVEY